MANCLVARNGTIHIRRIAVRPQRHNGLENHRHWLECSNTKQMVLQDGGSNHGTNSQGTRHDNKEEEYMAESRGSTITITAEE
jgi:hypothetical protein